MILAVHQYKKLASYNSADQKYTVLTSHPRGVTRTRIWNNQINTREFDSLKEFKSVGQITSFKLELVYE